MSFKRIITFLLVMVCIICFIPVNGAAASLPGNISIAAGKYHSLLAMEDGRLFVWGDNSKGQIGNSTKAQQNTPTQIMDNIYQVAAGDYTSYALTYSGVLYAWGDNSHGECGTDSSSAFSSPVIIMRDIISIDATRNHAYAVSSSGDLFFWGESAFRGQFPYVGEVNYTYRQPGGTALSYTPVKLMDKVKEVYCNGTSTSIIKTDDSLWCWSRYFNDSSELIDTTYKENSYGEQVRVSTWSMTPVKIAFAANAVAPNDSGGYSINDKGILCDWRGASAIALPDELKNNIKDISSSGVTSAFISNNSDLYVLNPIPNSLSGTGIYEYTSNPVVIARDVIKACVGQSHAIMVKQNGEVWTWGTNEYGQLGNSTGVNYNIPLRIMEGSGTENKGGLNNPLSIVFDGKKMHFDVEPVIRNNRTLVPFRAIFEALGADVSWDGNTSTATAIKGDKTIIIKANDNVAYVNGEPHILDVAPEIVSGRNMVPIRFISETMNCAVDYIYSDRIVDIRSQTAFNMFSAQVKSALITYNVYIEAGKYGDTVYHTATGVVIDPAGIILTNKHVTEGMDWIRTAINGNTYSRFDMIYEDEVLDYSIYRIVGANALFSVPEWGDSSRLNVYSELFSCGNPGGIRNQCFRGTVERITQTDVESTLDSKHGSSGSGVYNNALELVALVWAYDSFDRTLAIPMSLMSKKIEEAIAQYGIASQQNAA